MTRLIYNCISDLRLQLLDSDNSQELIKSLYGLLMLLPQSEAFQLLRRRLNCIPNFHLATVSQRYGLLMAKINSDTDSMMFCIAKSLQTH